MTPQDTYATFVQRFGSVAGKFALREFEGNIHAYPMRNFKNSRLILRMGWPVCGVDIRFIAARAMPTADAPTCEKCLTRMQKALGRE